MIEASAALARLETTPASELTTEDKVKLSHTYELLSEICILNERCTF